MVFTCHVPQGETSVLRCVTYRRENFMHCTSSRAADRNANFLLCHVAFKNMVSLHHDKCLHVPVLEGSTTAQLCVICLREKQLLFIMSRASVRIDLAMPHVPCRETDLFGASFSGQRHRPKSRWAKDSTDRAGEWEKRGRAR